MHPDDDRPDQAPRGAPPKSPNQNDTAVVRPTVIYRFYNADMQLLYVGITDRGPRRWREHMAEKPWWDEVETVELERCSTRDEALLREREIIRTEQPLYNVVHANTRPSGPTPLVTITWICDRCKQPIGDQQGSIFVRYSDLHRYHEAVAAWERAVDEHNNGSPFRVIPGGLLMDHPDPARWKVTHNDCDHDDTGSYWFDVSRARTVNQLLDWTIHLLETKDWITDTDWTDLVRRTATAVDA